MATTRRTEITIETSRRLVVRPLRGSFRAWCGGCLAEVRMITPNEAGALMNVSSRMIYQWIEDGRLHFTEEVGTVLVCIVSLLPDESEKVRQFPPKSVKEEREK